MDVSELRDRFTYHAPVEGQPEVYQGLRDGALLFALHINDVVPESREKSLALTKLEEAVMHANSGIARHGVNHTGG